MGSPKMLRRAVNLRLRPYVRMLVRAEADRLGEELRLELAEQLRTSPVIWAKIIPTAHDGDTLIVPGPDRTPTLGEDGLPLPPEEMWEVEGYLRGPEHVGAMREILASAGCELGAGGPILDFGCGSARMLRCLADVAAETPVWGVDINTASIAWCQANLSPPFHFAASTTMPSLPFEDRTFGLVYAGSVFTHISELADMWLAELRRITRPGGYLYLTVQDQGYIRAAMAQDPRHWTGELVASASAVLDRLGDDLAVVSLGQASKDAMVFHDRDSLVRSWGRDLEVLDVVEGAYDIQTAVVLRRPLEG